MNKNKYSVQIKTLVIAVLMFLTMSATAAVESTDPIKLTLHDWTGQYLTTNIMGEVLERAGYNIEYVQADYIAQFAGLAEIDRLSGRQRGVHGLLARGLPHFHRHVQIT